MMDGDSNRKDVYDFNVDSMEKTGAERAFRVLCEAFPDADPMFLRLKAEELSSDSLKLNDFALNVLYEGHYPQKSYPTPEPKKQFEIEAFLQKYPNPLKSFLANEKAVCYKDFSMCYLLSRFQNHSYNVIRDHLFSAGFSLSAAGNLLCKLPSTIEVPREEEFCCISPTGPPPDEFLDEVTFFENRREIEIYMRNVLPKRKYVEQLGAGTSGSTTEDPIGTSEREPKRRKIQEEPGEC